MSFRRKRSKAAVALATVALAGVLLVAAGTGSTSRSWSWEGGVPGEPTAGTSSPDRVLVAEGDLALVAAPQDGALAVGTAEGELAPLADLAGDEPLVVFAAGALDGGPQRLVGVARSDVQQVEAVLRDGTTQELPLNEWRAFSFIAPTLSETALGLVARSGDSEVGVVRVPQTTATLAQQGVTPYRFTNLGVPVDLRDDSTRLFNGHKANARLLATEAGRAFYRLRPRPDIECYATGKASKLGEITSTGCPGRPGGQPLIEFGAFSQKPGTQPRADRLEGFAADEVATVVAVDEHGNRFAEATPRANVYVFRPAPPAARKVIALDASGDPLPPRAVPRVSFPLSLLGPQVTRVRPTAIRAPIRRGSDRGVKVIAGRNGVAVFSTDGADPAIAAALHRAADYGCFRLAKHPWDTEDPLLLVRSYQPRLALRIQGLRTPFDGCEIQASYGHRWPDRLDSHSAVEVAFNERARRYFDDRATARDLALFLRSGDMKRLRRKTGSVLWASLHARYKDAVVFVPTASAKPPIGKIGVWVLGPRTILSKRSPTGARLFVELRNGRIVGHNLRQLVKVF